MLRPILVALALLISPAAFTRAAEALKAQLTPLANRPRSEGPMLLDAKLTWLGSGLIEGALEITFLQNGEPVCVQTTQEMALANGTRSFRLLSPPIAARNGAELGARLRFVSRRGEIQLGNFPLALDRYGDRNFLIAACTPHGVGNQRLTALWQSLRFERFQPPSGSGTVTRSLGTAPVYFAPEDFPSDPLAFIAFDVVLIEGDALGALREKQLAALARWVEAGGSVCVMPGGRLKDEHVRFLNALAAAKTDQPAFTLDAEFRAAGPNLLLIHAGFGRAVIAAKPPENADDFETAEWRRAAAFLWKFRVLQAERVASEGRWRGNADVLKYDAAAGKEKSDRANANQQWTSALVPKSSRLIPFSVVAAILGAFLVAIGPADWFVLGRLRRRRWTWVTFPVCSVAFTLLTTFAAEHYLGGQDHQAAFVITDIGRDGRVAKETRFEMHFAARNRELTSEFRQGIAAPWQNLLRGTSSTIGEDAMPKYAGQFPQRYALRQPIRQWTPHIDRVTSLEDAADPSGINWSILDFENADAAGRPAHFAELAARHPDCVFYIFHSAHAGTSFGSGPVHLESAVRALCMPGAFGLDSIAVSASPQGAADLTDLQCFEEDTTPWVIAALRQTAGDIHLYRRIFRHD
jgi:hypothetical protein